MTFLLTNTALTPSAQIVGDGGLHDARISNRIAGVMETVSLYGTCLHRAGVSQKNVF